MTYRLNRHGREFYDQRIAVVDEAGAPVTLAWEASFDGGTTWAAGTALTGEDAGWVRWLIAGDRADLGAAVAQLTPTGDEDLQPLARAVANPEIVVRNLEPIRVE